MDDDSLHAEVLHLVGSNDIGLLRQLLQSHPGLVHMDVRFPNGRDSTLFNSVVVTNNVSAVRLFLENGANATAVSLALTTSLEMCQLLLDHGVPVDELLPSGLTALHFAVSENQVEMAQLLLRHGADPNLPKPSSGSTPLDYAVGENHAGMARCLIEAGADVNRQRVVKHLENSGNHFCSLLSLAILKAASDAFDELFLASTPVDVNAPGLWSETTMIVSHLHVAVFANVADEADTSSFVIKLLEKGADPSAMDSSGRTPLELAVELGHVNSIYELLRWNPGGLLA